eukprot:gene9167-biopygen3188
MRRIACGAPWICWEMRRIACRPADIPDQRPAAQLSYQTNVRPPSCHTRPTSGRPAVIPDQRPAAQL